MNCAEVGDEMIAARRGESERASEVYAHLADCAGCRDLADRMGRTLALLDREEGFEPSEAVWSAVRGTLVAEGAIRETPLRRKAIELGGRIRRGSFKYVAAVVVAVGAISLLVQRTSPWRSREAVASAGDRGSVYVKRGGDGPWLKLKAGGLVNAGDKVATTPETSGAIRLASGFSVGLEAGTALAVPESAWVVMYAGHVYIAGPGSGSDFTVETEAARVRATGTRFSVQITEGATRVTVIEGEVVVANREGAVPVKAGYLVTAVKGESPSKPTRTDPARAIGSFVEPEGGPEVKLQVSGDLREGSPSAAVVTVTNRTDEPMQVRSADSVEPFYMFRIRRGADSWMVQAVPEARAADKSDSVAGATGGFVGLDPGKSYSFRCDLTGSLGASGGRCVVTAIYYSYPGGSMPPGVWTGTTESAPVVVETKGTR